MKGSVERELVTSGAQIREIGELEVFDVDAVRACPIIFQSDRQPINCQADKGVTAQDVGKLATVASANAERFFVLVNQMTKNYGHAPRVKLSGLSGIQDQFGRVSGRAVDGLLGVPGGASHDYAGYPRLFDGRVHRR